jgi:hypothetical protein
MCSATVSVRSTWLGPPGRRRDAGLDPVFRRRRNVRPTDPSIVTADERADEVIEPVGIRHAVGVGIGEHFALGRGRTGVARVTKTVVLLPDVADLRKARGDLGVLSVEPSSTRIAS